MFTPDDTTAGAAAAAQQQNPAGAGAPIPQPEFPDPAKAPETAPAPKVSAGRQVTVFFPKDQPFDGELEATATVTKVLEDGSVNVRVLAPNGGPDLFITGVKTTAERDALGDDDAAKNLAAWDWPARV